jgi:hypothetical protein
VRCADLGQAAALGLRGAPAADDGLAATTVEGAPHPDEWPAALFVHGTLRPGRRAWPLVAGETAGRPRRAAVAGWVGDTGRGHTALVPGGATTAPGWVVPVREPVALLPRLDACQSPEHRRVRLATADGTACWAWVCATDQATPVPQPVS